MVESLRTLGGKNTNEMCVRFSNYLQEPLSTASKRDSQLTVNGKNDGEYQTVHIDAEQF